jgi:putative FmdB family regulatory protein
MPIYEYECAKCGHDFEVLQKISDGALRKCPKCGALRLKRLVSAPQFRLKGTGWYETDFKKDNKKRLVETGDGKPAAEAKTDKADKTATEKAAKPEKKEQATAKKPASGASDSS